MADEHGTSLLCNSDSDVFLSVEVPSRPERVTHVNTISTTILADTVTQYNMIGYWRNPV